jgi:hypothetical protein
MIASTQYQALSLPFGDVTYTVYTLPRHVPLASIALKTTIQAALLYTSLYGPYPYTALRVAEFSGRGAWNSPASWCWARVNSTIMLVRCATA